MMEQLIKGFPQQMERAIALGETLSPPQSALDIRNIVVVGLGGSGIGADLVQALCADKLSLPFSVCKHYQLPAYLDAHTLVIASSFSGNTEETLAAVEVAVARKATVFCITSGGKLATFAQEKGLFTALLPIEAACPRAHLGYSCINLLFILQKIGLLPTWSLKEELTQSFQNLHQKQAQIRQKADSLAADLVAKVPFLYADSLIEPLLIRFKQQINENAKQLCHTAVFPEMNHNELVGWVFPAFLLEKIQVLYLQTSYDHPRVGLRMDVCEPIFKAKNAGVIRLQAEGSSFLEEVFYLLHLTDWASFYLALHNGVDPFPVEVINHLKSELAKH
ncbi:bifunctional phosphoglucose/phosphomannose isomerase [Hugenholtzia roseola]|uniref:bifunctional phosphoglucose/phosphomannose isomerase n=1 Tax=Hugenholtzia roseola TaxID=1002 RepID=UPI0004163592|nr:bifunctional phosphoglucose/phosphomannose isomerase [Hugenholtzia roseola]